MTTRTKALTPSLPMSSIRLSVGILHHDVVFAAWMLFCIVASTGFCCTLIADEVSVPMVTGASSPVSTTMNATIGIYNTAATEANRRLSDYDADANGQWTQPKTRSSSSNQFVPLRLETPSGMIRIELSVLIDGMTPEQNVEKLLDQVIDRAGKTTDPPTRSINVDASFSEDINKDESNQTADESSVTPTTYVRDTVLTKLERFIGATGAEGADREELRWMLDQWRPGPLWLIARDAVSPPQRSFEPLLSWLDLDRDGNLDAAEQAEIPARLNRLDDNRDRIVQTTELEAAIARDRRTPIRAETQTRWSLQWADVDAASSANDLLEKLHTVTNIRTANATHHVASIVDDVLKTKLEESLSSQLTVRSDRATVSGSGNRVTVSLNKNERPIQIHLIGYSAPNLSPVARCQFSIAARLGHQPLWDQLDTDADGRLGELEQRVATDRLAALDHNADGTITPDEWPISFHLVFSQGNDATTYLNSSTSVSSTMPPTNTEPVPDWFAGMDTNQDGSVSPDEFLGSPKQFAKYDRDGDGLVTPSELTHDDQP
ncbi:EF-hand domain-containing protein [Rhodopirellula sp. SWK7]|uniref:EF-hand domain-containing protein n=1 Tax=Rhodopirellula sp. SWK7 TaxID=595460 RepID=UPI0002BEC99C|nr:calmodulin [Rhodopirellula sp. SWK7]EMI40603.1 calmodulin [Rhodopirellula sp. SWK7]